MKKLLSFCVVLLAGLVLAGCSNDYIERGIWTKNYSDYDPVTDLNVSWEKTSAGEFSKSYGEITTDDSGATIKLYIELSSGSYKPLILGVKKEDDVLMFAYSYSYKGDYHTCDMAYWIANIKTDLDYVEGINSVSVFYDWEHSVKN